MSAQVNTLFAAIYQANESADFPAFEATIGTTKFTAVKTTDQPADETTRHTADISANKTADQQTNM